MPEISDKDGAITGALFQFFATSSSFIAGAIFYIYLSKFYSSTYVGFVSLFIAVAGIFSSVFSFGLAQASQHFISYYLGRSMRGKIAFFIKRTLKYAFLLSLIAGVLMALLSPVISSDFFHSASYTPVLQLLSIYVFESIMFSILAGMYLGLQNFKRGGIISVVTVSVAYLVASLLLYSFRNPEWIVIGWISGYAIGLIMFSIGVFRRTAIVGSSESFPYSQVFKYSVPILFSSIISVGASYIDRFVVAFFIGISTLGIYNFAILITTTLALFLTPIYNVIMPKMSELFSQGDVTAILRGLRVSSTIVTLFYVPAALGGAALGIRILSFLATPEYGSASIAMVILLIVYAMFITQGVLVQAVSSTRNTAVFLISASLTLISNVTLSFLLIPHYGMLGAAIANSSVTAVSFIVLYLYSLSIGYVSYDRISILKVWISSGIMALIVYFVSSKLPPGGIYLGALVILGTVLYLVIAKVMRIFGQEDKNWLLSVFTGKYGMFSRIIDFLF